MNRRMLIPGLTLTLSLATPLHGFCAVPINTLTAAEIVNRNIAARGGLQAWRHVQAISMSGNLGVGGAQRASVAPPLPGKQAEQLPTDVRPAEEVQLPFIMEMVRPRKVRFELQFKGQTAVQIFDGLNGWKLRPYLNRQEVEPYTTSELKQAAAQADLDGPLVDYAAKGTTIALDGTEPVEGRACYKLALTLKTGQVIHLWVDARTFLEAKIEGQPRKLDGIEHPVEIYYRDYRSVNGLQIPYTLETTVLPSTTTKGRQTTVPAERINLQKVVINPPLDAALFVKPELIPTTSSQPTPSTR